MFYLRLLACAVSFVTLGGGFVMLNRDYSKQLSVSNGGQYGYWGTPEFCPVGMYASGYSMKIESSQLFGDDTALNAIRLLCSTKDGHRNATHQVRSTEGPFGTWTKEETCGQDFEEPSFMTSFQLQVEPQQGSGDDTGANYVNFQCREIATDDNSNTTDTVLSVPPGHGAWGTWGEWSESCVENEFICGINTKVKVVQGSNDDTALNDVIFYCCE